MDERTFDEIVLQVEADWIDFLAEFEAMWLGERLLWQETEGLEAQPEQDIPPGAGILL